MCLDNISVNSLDNISTSVIDEEAEYDNKLQGNDDDSENREEMSLRFKEEEEEDERNDSPVRILLITNDHYLCR